MSRDLNGVYEDAQITGAAAATTADVDVDALLAQHRTKSGVIRHLFDTGVKMADIARILNIRYQFVYNVIQRSHGSQKREDPIKLHEIGGTPTRENAEAAVRTLIAWIGESPSRDGLVRTPARVTSSLEDLCDGYASDPLFALSRSFPATDTNPDMVLVKSINVQSTCEHHMLPFLGYAHVAYIPDEKLVGLSKIARAVEILSRRLQTQERLTRQICDAMVTALQPKGVAVFIDAEHHCMKLRGVKMPNASTTTTCFVGKFKTDESLKERFLAALSQTNRG